MEVNLARVKHERPDAQIIALSATVGNADEIADWLQAKKIQSERRMKIELQIQIRRTAMAPFCAFQQIGAHLNIQ